jgi:hypothetical protein
MATKPTAIRWRLYALLLMVVTLTFIDRFNMNVAAKYIQQEFYGGHYLPRLPPSHRI